VRRNGRRLLGIAGAVTGAMKTVARAAGLGHGPSLRVIVYHDVPLSLRSRCAAQLGKLARTWRFVSPSEFERMLTGDMPLLGRNLLVTFDDGFASNRAVAEEVLRPMGIQALFFIVPEFVGFSDTAASRRYIVQRIQPGRAIETLDPGLNNMGWADLEALLEMGHAIGAHTCTHARIATLNTTADREHEISDCADIIESRLGCRVNHFAFPYGEIASITEDTLEIAARRYQFVHSGLRGENCRISPLAVRRDVVAPTEAIGVVEAFVEGLVDIRYARSRAILDRWAARVDEASR